MNITKLFSDFFRSEKTSGLLLVICTIISLLLSNSSLQHGYIQFWETNLIRASCAAARVKPLVRISGVKRVELRNR